MQIDKTNGEYQQEVRERWPANAKPFGQLTNQFDEIWYGEKHATENEFTLYQRKIMEFVEKGGQDEKR
nr:DUF4129 domain-containing protein [Paenactinomyces guangxiensis]